jgi:hypothetical protein
LTNFWLIISPADVQLKKLRNYKMAFSADMWPANATMYSPNIGQTTVDCGIKTDTE